MTNTTNSILVHSNMEIAPVSIEDLYTNTLTAETKRSYMQTIKEFFNVQELHEISIEDMQCVTPDMANAYAHKLLDKGIAKATINKKLSALQNFYKFLCRRNIGIMTYNPFSTDEGCIRFKNASKDYSDKRVLAPEEIKALFDSARNVGGIIGLRDLLILEMLATTGMRRAEICGIKIGDIKLNLGKKIIEITGKGDKTRMIVVSGKVDKLIDEYLDARGVTYKDKDLPLLTTHSPRGTGKPMTANTVYRAVKAHADNAGIDADSISPHALRATYATTVYDQLDMNVNTIRELMGHSSVATTQRYIKSVNMIKNNPADTLDNMFK
ncbi:MAG: tyrosine-type recombinase/integrase [Cellulosilyticum sp.]|jgi:site-specific recombinase XerD|nr:tyrosine-type recombinase/integrase [Cellulosilyticum sp.]